MPDKYKAYGEQLQELNPGWEYTEWNLDNMPPIINQSTFDAIAGMPKSSITMDPARAIAVQQADVLGYEIVYQFGGIYLNTDIQPLRPFDELLEETKDTAFACWEGLYGDRWFLVNALLGGPKGHRFYGDIIDELPLRYLNMFMAPMEQTTGPHLITDIYERKWQKNPGFTALPKHYFNPVHFGEIEIGQDASSKVEWARQQGAFGLHHWGHREDQANYV